MESRIEQEARGIYNKLLQSKALFKQLGQIQFAAQPKEVVYRENKLVLYHYQPQVKKIAEPPLLIVFALINRPDILDFSAEASFIKGLLQAGRDVYLLDWGYPSSEDCDLSLSTYVADYLRNCIQKIKSHSRQSQVDLLGICQGGVLSLCYASLFPQDLRRLVLISTPVDFQTKTDRFSRLAQRLPLEKRPVLQGNLPGAWLANLFVGLRPFHLLGKKYLGLLDQLSRPEPDAAWLKHFLLVEKWLLDTPDLAGKAFSQFIQIFYQQNSLLRGKFDLDKYCVDLRSITTPVLNVIAREDHIVPPRASRILGKYLPLAAHSQRTLPAGHIGIYLSQKTSQRLPKMIAAWLRKKEVRTVGRDDGRTAKGKDKGRGRRVGE
jgi:polyhydroxyalkanoate synthase